VPSSAVSAALPVLVDVDVHLASARQRDGDRRLRRRLRGLLRHELHQHLLALRLGHQQAQLVAGLDGIRQIRHEGRSGENDDSARPRALGHTRGEGLTLPEQEVRRLPADESSFDLKCDRDPHCDSDRQRPAGN
jgi:hypothetical protein